MTLKVEADRDVPSSDTVIIRVEGEVDVYTSPRLKQEIMDELAAGRTRLIVDLNAVEYLDSTALGVLIGGLKRARERGGDLQLICDNVRILRIFEITGLTRIFQIYRSRSEALAPAT